jgi:hypothetical protein
MKKLHAIFLLFIFFPFPLISNETPNRGNLTGFLGVPWEASAETVEKIMKDHGFIKRSANRDDDLRVYLGTFAGKEDSNVNIHFFNDRFYGVAIAYDYKEDEIATHYRRFVAYFSLNYGAPDISESDDNLYSEWRFPNDTYIYVATSDNSIYICYGNDIMNDEVARWQNENPEQMEIKRQEIRQSQISYFSARILVYYRLNKSPDFDKSRQEPMLNELCQYGKRLFELTDDQLNSIRNNRLYIGMHYTLVYLAWGDPDDKIKTVDARGEHIKYVYEQWPGRYKYAYTDNDYLTSWQE